MQETKTCHGGDIEIFARNYSLNMKEIIDFSGNTNPFGPPKLFTDLNSKMDIISKYPDIDYVNLRKSIAVYTNTTAENVVIGCGATEMINILIKYINPKNALVISPCYSEYEQELRKNGTNINLYQLEEVHNFQVNLKDLFKSLKTDKITNELLVICNPNNPTGSFIECDKMVEILEFCKLNNIFVMIDETYAEFVLDQNSTCSTLTNTYNNLFVIRGVSKFFCAPGLRLGYGICNDKNILKSINNLKLLWSVSSMSAMLGEIMFLDEEYITNTRIYISQEMNKIKEMLDKNYYKIYDTKSNFALIKLLNNNINSTDLFLYLIKNNMLVRNCNTFHFLGEKFIRVCISTKKNNEKLVEYMNKFVK